MKIVIFVTLAFILGVGVSQLGFRGTQANGGKETEVSQASVSCAASAAALPAPVVAAAEKKVSAYLAQLPPERKQILDTLSSEDIDAWKKIRSDRQDDFLKTNSDFWQAGGEAERDMNPGRLDLPLLQEGTGAYSGLMKYDIRELNLSAEYSLDLALNNFREKGKNTLAMKSATGGSMKIDFTYRFLGTDGRDINVVWYNFNSAQEPYVSTFAFKLKPGMAMGEKWRTQLMGLDKNLQWNPVGTVDLAKIK